MNPLVLLAAVVAGGVGAAARYALDVLIMHGRTGHFPIGILIVNVSGSFLLGLLTGLGASVLPGEFVVVLGTGLLGGYTTFSTVSVETVLLATGRERRRAALNVLGTLLLSVAAAALGLLLTAVS